MSVTQVIQPKKKLLISEDQNPHNVCAYCRVSTDEQDQKNSLLSQQKFFESYFKLHPNWRNVGIFADEGLSGTLLDNREQFKTMLTHARQGNVDLILTKEVSRFSRNVQDLLNIVEELRDRSVYIWFLSDDINSERADYREKLTAAGNSAEQESLRTSRRVRWGQMQQMERGCVFGRKEMFGYRIERDECGQQRFVIIPDEAEIIKLIFKWFAAGDGTFRIAKRLEQMKIVSNKYKNGWSNTVVLRILCNEKYVGDLLQGKTYTPDPLKHKKKYNHGESLRYYTKDHHPEAAIIDRELWETVQRILKVKSPDDFEKRKFSNRYWISGKIFCGCCGSRYVSVKKQQKTTVYKAWACFNNNQHGLPHNVTNSAGKTVCVGCTARRINDRVLQSAIYDILTELISPYRKDIIHIFNTARKRIKQSIIIKREVTKVTNKINEIQRKAIQLTSKYLDGIIPEEIYATTAKEINSQLDELRKEYYRLQNHAETATIDAQHDEVELRIKRLVELQDQTINEGLFERITKKIVVHPGNVLEIHLTFLAMPIHLSYKTTGKGESFRSTFTVINNGVMP